MTITLLAISLNEQPLSQPITAVFDSHGGTIGRADHNTMALPDPERHISRLQVEIVATGSGYLIKNVGAANPIVVAGRTLTQGESATLAHRDQIRIGGYLLQVEVGAAGDQRSAEITRGRAVATGGVSAEPRTDAWPRESIPPSVAPRTAPPAPIGGMPDFGLPLSSSNPFADLMGAPPAAAPAAHAPAPPSSDPFADLMPAPAGIAAGSKAVAPTGAPGPGVAARLPDDFDPFAAPAPARPAARPPEPSGNTFADLLPKAGAPSIDDLFGLRGQASTDPLANFMAGTPVPPAGAAASGPAQAPAAGGMPTDPLALFGGTDSPAPSRAPTAANHTPDLHAGFVAPQVVAPAAPPAAASAPAMLPTGLHWLNPPSPQGDAYTAIDAGPTHTTAAGAFRPAAAQPAGEAADIELDLTQSGLARPPVAAPAMAAVAAPMPAAAAALPAAGAGAAAASQPGAEALWAAFCQGAGIEVSRMPALTPAMMHDIGALLRAAVEGTLQLMAVRATTKHELRAAVTMIQARNNNPLKFSPDASSGIEQLLQPTMRGFLSGPAAMSDAMHDLVGHSIGTVAGMRAALDGMLGRFAPSELEDKLVGKSLLDSVLPMNRKAKLWELYLQHFESIREEAQEDFHTLFGKAFLAAYEQQLERLKREGGHG